MNFRTLRTRVAPALKTALLHSGGYRLMRTVAPSRTTVAILRYHAIADDAWYADAGISISPAAFDAHAQYLAAQYSVLPLDEVVTRLRERRPLPHNCVVITFDDGYADNLAAARVLHRRGLTATFYITAGCLADGDPFWPSELRHLIARLTDERLTMTAGAVHLDLPLHTAADRTAAILALTRAFKANPIAVRDELRAQLRARVGVPAPRVMLTWDEVREMHRLGMTIGSHTLTHPNLPSAGLEVATREITESKQRLELAIDAPVTMFSYPNGGAERYYTPRLQQIVARSRFAAAASSRNAFAGYDSDLFALERIEVEERLEDLVFALDVERFAFKPKPRPMEMRR